MLTNLICLSVAHLLTQEHAFSGPAAPLKKTGEHSRAYNELIPKNVGAMLVVLTSSLSHHARLLLTSHVLPCKPCSNPAAILAAGPAGRQLC